jgi:hypothetical protein
VSSHRRASPAAIQCDPRDTPLAVANRRVLSSSDALDQPRATHHTPNLTPHSPESASTDHTQTSEIATAA